MNIMLGALAFVQGVTASLIGYLIGRFVITPWKARRARVRARPGTRA